jgi:hypothetical protein
VEQDRAGLQSQLVQANAAAAEGDAARAKLKSELRQAVADRDEAVRLNLKLQVQHSAMLQLTLLIFLRACAWNLFAVAWVN